MKPLDSPHPRIKPLRRVKDNWTAGGHNFDEGMRCFHCGRTWVSHQSRPTYCRKAAALLRKQDARHAA